MEIRNTQNVGMAGATGWKVWELQVPNDGMMSVWCGMPNQTQNSHKGVVIDNAQDPGLCKELQDLVRRNRNLKGFTDAEIRYNAETIWNTYGPTLLAYDAGQQVAVVKKGPSRRPRSTFAVPTATTTATTGPAVQGMTVEELEAEAEAVLVGADAPAPAVEEEVVVTPSLRGQARRKNSRLKIYYGDPGTGKTYKARHETKYIMACSPDMHADDMLKDFDFQAGSPAFNETVIAECARKGESLALDEVNLLPMDTLRFLQAITDDKPEVIYKGRTYPIADGFQLIGTMNLDIGNGMEVPLPPALVDRACEIVKFELTPLQLAKIAWYGDGAEDADVYADDVTLAEDLCKFFIEWNAKVSIRFATELLEKTREGRVAVNRYVLAYFDISGKSDCVDLIAAKLTGLEWDSILTRLEAIA